MSSTSTPENTEPGDNAPPPPMPLAADRPVVDGTRKSSEEIRAELEQLLEEDRRREEELANSSAETVGQLVSRAGPVPRPGATRPPAPQPQAPREGAPREGTRARAALPERVLNAQYAVQEKPGLLAAVAGVLVLILLVRRRLKSG
jgi:hypothetical protein